MATISQDKVKKLQELLAMVNEGLTREEFVKSFEAVLKILTDLEEKLTKRMDTKAENTLQELGSLKNDFNSFIEQAKKDSESTFGAIRRNAIERVDNAFVKNEANRKLTTALDAVNEKLTELDKRIAEIKNGENGVDGKDADEEAMMERIMENMHKMGHTPEETRDALESIKDEEEKLKIEAVGHLREELDQIKKDVKAKMQVMGGGIIGRDYFKTIDISSQLNGSTTTFNINAVWTILSVVCSSFPHALRPTIDYTWTSTTITFTSQINPATTLASGQTVILTVVRA